MVKHSVWGESMRVGVVVNRSIPDGRRVKIHVYLRNRRTGDVRLVDKQSGIPPCCAINFDCSSDDIIIIRTSVEHISLPIVMKGCHTDVIPANTLKLGKKYMMRTWQARFPFNLVIKTGCIYTIARVE